MKTIKKSTSANVKCLLKGYMFKDDISWMELSRRTGIDYQRLLYHLKKPELFRVYELKAINDELNLSNEDLAYLIRLREN